jgi:hypothetical protein
MRIPNSESEIAKYEVQDLFAEPLESEQQNPGIGRAGGYCSGAQPLNELISIVQPYIGDKNIATVAADKRLTIKVVFG